MGLFKKGPKGEKCSVCKEIMELKSEQLYAMPNHHVGHYGVKEEGAYFKRNLVPIESKAQIPTGMYACRARLYHCPKCGHEMIRFHPFLPVRDQEMAEFPVTLEYAELDAFLK